MKGSAFVPGAHIRRLCVPGTRASTKRAEKEGVKFGFQARVAYVFILTLIATWLQWDLITRAGGLIIGQIKCEFSELLEKNYVGALQ